MKFGTMHLQFSAVVNIIRPAALVVAEPVPQLSNVGRTTRIEVWLID
jgi:hypothetical protein